HAVFGADDAGASADVVPTDIQTAPSVIAASVVTEIERRKRSRMSASPRPQSLPKRIVVAKARRVVVSQRIGTLSVGELLVLEARRFHHRRKADIPFVAARLVVNPILLIALFRELLLDRPRPHPHRRVLDRGGVFERVWTGPCPSFDDMQIFARAAE